MKVDQFYAKVRERGNYADAAEAERVTKTVLGVLGQRLAGGEAKDLAAQLPGELQPSLQAGSSDADGGFGAEEFLTRAAAELGATRETATWDVSAVLTTVAEAITGGQLNQVLTQLQPEYAQFFGKPELS